MKNMIASLLVVALTSCQMWADPGPDQAHTDAVKKKVVHCLDHQGRVVLETYDNRRLQGVITEAGAEDFVVSYAGQATTLPYRDVTKIKWQSPVSRHVRAVLLNMALAAAFAAAMYGAIVLLGGTRG